MFIWLRKGMIRNLMELNKVKGKVLHLWKNKPKHHCRLEDVSMQKEELRACREYTLIPKKGNGILGCIRQSQPFKEGDPSPATQQWWSQHPEFWAQFWAPL